jgi:hypothetical protein
VQETVLYNTSLEHPRVHCSDCSFSFLLGEDKAFVHADRLIHLSLDRPSASLYLKGALAHPSLCFASLGSPWVEIIWLSPLSFWVLGVPTRETLVPISDLHLVLLCVNATSSRPRFSAYVRRGERRLSPQAVSPGRGRSQLQDQCGLAWSNVCRVYRIVCVNERPGCDTDHTWQAGRFIMQKPARLCKHAQPCSKTRKLQWHSPQDGQKERQDSCSPTLANFRLQVSDDFVLPDRVTVRPWLAACGPGMLCMNDYVPPSTSLRLCYADRCISFLVYSCKELSARRRRRSVAQLLAGSVAHRALRDVHCANSQDNDGERKPDAEINMQPSPSASLSLSSFRLSLYIPLHTFSSFLAPSCVNVPSIDRHHASSLPSSRY